MFQFVLLCFLFGVSNCLTVSGFVKVKPEDWYVKTVGSPGTCFLSGITGPEVFNENCTRHWVRLDTLAGCHDKSIHALIAPLQNANMDCMRIPSPAPDLNILIRYYSNCDILCRRNSVWTRSNFTVIRSLKSELYKMYVEYGTTWSNETTITTVEATTVISPRGRKPFGNNPILESVLPINPAKQLYMSIEFNGRTNILETKDLINDVGPATDRKGKVYMKGYYPSKEGKASIWFVIPDPSNLNDFVVQEPYRHVSYTFSFYNSSRTFTYYRFTVSDDEDNKVTCKRGERESTVKISKHEATHGCTSENSIIEEIIFSDRPKFNYETYLICLNGTVLETNQNVNLENCSNAYLNKYFTTCKHKKSSCTIEDSHKSRENHFLMKLKLSGEGVVKADSDIDSKKVQCKGECSFEIKANKEVKILCPDGTTRVFHLISDLSEKCPFLSYWLTSRMAAAVCRISFNPSMFGWLAAWLWLGIFFLSLVQDITDFLLICSTKLFSICKSKMGANYDYCPHCLTRIEFSSLLENHTRCSRGTCPYCNETLTEIDKLPSHASNCKKRIYTIDNARKKEVREWRTERTVETARRAVYNKKMKKSIYYVVAIVIFYYMITPATAFVEIKDDWEEFKKEIDNCGTHCWRTGDSCECPESEKIGRVLLANPDSPTDKVSGFLDINGTFSVTDNMRVVDLSFNTEAKANGKVVITGNSVATLPIESGTGLTWKISSENSDEKKTLSIGIYEAAQIYSTVFKYHTSDRKIKTGNEFQCTYSCHKDCTCTSPTCLTKSYPKDRSWSCNPTWCLRWGAGCTCCFAYADASSATTVFSVFDTQYERTDLILCLNYDHPKYTCFNINEGGTFQIENFELKVSKVFGIDRKLPKKIATVHKKHRGTFDTENPDTVLLDPEIKQPNSVVHGDIGDFTFDSWDMFLEGEKDTSKMIWSGATMERTCHTGEYPECKYYGISMDITDTFNNMIDTTEQLKTNYEILSDKVSALDNSLSLKVKPRKNAGLMELALKINGLELQKLDKKPEINKFEITNCKGCRGCHLGFWCIIKISLKKPSKFSIHLISKTNDIAVETNSIIAKNSLTSYNISLFTPVKLDYITLCIQETDDCSTSKKVTLDEPVKLLITKREALVSNTVEKDTKNNNFFEQIWEGMKHFVLGIPDFFISFFRNWWFVLIVALLIFFTYLLLKTKIGKIFFCFFPGRLLQYLHSRKKVEESANEIIQHEKSEIPLYKFK